MGPASYLGSTVEVTLLTEVQVSWPLGYDCGTPNDKTLICNVVVRMREQCLPHLCPPLLCLSPVVDQGAALGKGSPAPLLCRTVELTPLKQQWVNSHKNVSMGDLTPLLICHMVVWAGEKYFPHSAHVCLRQVGEP